MALGYGLNPTQYRSFSSLHKIVTLLLLLLLFVLWMLGYGPNAFRNCTRNISANADAMTAAPIPAPTSSPPPVVSPEPPATAPAAPPPTTAAAPEPAAPNTPIPATPPAVEPESAKLAENTPSPAPATAKTASVAKPPNAAVYFDQGKSNLPRDAARRLAKVIAYLKANPRAKVVLSGFHDRSGPQARNIQIARERAQTVSQALAKAGISSSRIIAEKPRNTVGTGKAKDARRVEVKIRQ
jgi:outer membrane protein OmpA-like peptidoglycan-associated protein